MTQWILLASGIVAVLAAGFGVLVVWLWKLSQTMKAAEQPDNSGVMLQQQIEALRKQVQDSLTAVSQTTHQQLSNIALQVQNQMQNASQNIQATTGQINSRLDNYQQVVQGVSKQLGELAQATQNIFEATKNIATLEEILKPPKMRGGMGEVMLENILKEIFPSQNHIHFQYGFKSGNKVDAVIRLNDGLIPIDAKFPLDNFRKMLETPEEKDKQAFRKEFIKNVKKHIDDISAKYILPDEGTFDFALMYVPAENIYYETIIRSDGDAGSADLYAYATQKKVFPVSPNSLYPYLTTIALGFRGLKIEQQAKQILTELSRLHGDLSRFAEDFETVGKHLSNAQNKFADAEKKLDRVTGKIEALKDGSSAEKAPSLEDPDAFKLKSV